MNTQTKNTIENFLRSHHFNKEVYIMDYVNIEDIDTSDAFNSIYDMIEDNGGFNIDVIYYSDAIEYLKQHDQSLSDSLEIAIEYGYTIENINSELLASLLKSQNVREEFNDLRNEINTFFEELEEDTIQTEFENCDKMKIFEIPVINKQTNEEDYIIFDISIENNKFIATHEPTTHEEETSTKIAYVEIDIDPLFSLDEHLQELHEECTYKIINSDFFTLN